ncbi:hypothetical protein EG329_013043 [Mollisiaceae sp. DMI_Dod_QoI]|nr:hypothetical protein EG329_013043 [Helotiales sp. DMI_Dod_QoI]
MDQTTTTTARLRKTFHYPTDNDSDSSLPEALDEEEQTHLIHTLHVQNARTNNTYRLLLLPLPLLSLIPYLPSLFSFSLSPPSPSSPSPSPALRIRFLALLSVSSLLSTAFLLYALPPGRTGIGGLDRLNAAASGSSSSKGGGRRKGGLLDEEGEGEGDGPVKKFLPYLNLGLCAVLVVLGMMVDGGKGEVWWGFGWVPAGVYGVVVLAKWVMGGVDPEAELGGLRYGFKGA